MLLEYDICHSNSYYTNTFWNSTVATSLDFVRGYKSHVT